MGGQPITDITSCDLECGVASDDGEYCCWYGVAIITWLGRRGYWTCPACHADHEEGTA